jgi:hypothetical protein
MAYQIQKFNQVAARNKPHTRIDAALYERVGKMANEAGVTKNEMVEELIQLGIITKTVQELLKQQQIQQQMEN